MRSIALSFVALVTLVSSATQASFSLQRAHIPIEGEKLDRGAIFARVDSLMTSYDAALGEERGLVARRLGELYLATGMIKHRPRALEFLDEAARLDADPRGAVELLASTLHAMRFVGEARQNFLRLTEIAPDDPSVFMDLGRFHFLEARRRMDRDGFRDAGDAFVRACALDPDDAEAWFGQAASALAYQDYETAARAADELVALRADWTTARLLSAAAHQGTGDGDTAWRDFHLAFDRLPPDVAVVFTAAEGFVDPRALTDVARALVPREEIMAAFARGAKRSPADEDELLRVALRDSTVRDLALSLFLDQNDDRPAQDYRVGHMRFWSRVVEADVLFGDPEEGVRGWETPMGEALVRWGRPTKTYYHPGFGSIRDVMNAYGYAFPVGWTFITGTAQFIWGFDDHPDPFALIFFDEVRQDRFTYEDQTSQLVHVMRQTMPMAIPTPPEPSTPFTVALSRAVFPRGWDEAVVETYVALRPKDISFVREGLAAARDTVAIVEWALFDGRRRRIDHRREVIDGSLRRSVLRAAAGAEATADSLEPWLLTVGANVPAGEYRLAIEVATPDGAQRNVAALNLSVPRTIVPTLIEMSDLQVATHFDRYRAHSAVPHRFVKFGQVVLPAPDLRIPESATTMAVYFEVRHLGLDADARTHFDVTYEVFEADRQVRDMVAARADFVSGDLERVEPLTLGFLEERTGVSSRGLVVKGTELDVTDLLPGDYVLSVTIHDRISGRSASRSLPFRRQGR